jgi:hypothetical protein
MAAGEYILLVRNLGAFWLEFGAVGGGIQVFEWGVGKLDNGGEKIQLSKPGDEVDGTRYYIRVDRVNYSDGSHPVGEDPWPTEADGAGSSLSRKILSDYGNDVTNWKAASPSPGAANPYYLRAKQQVGHYSPLSRYSYRLYPTSRQARTISG